MEREPLISTESSDNHIVGTPRLISRPTTGKELPYWALLRFFALELCIKFGATLLELPTLRLVERMVCSRFFDAHHNDSDEESCKIPAVQNKVASIMGYKTTMDALPCLLTVLFYGWLSNFRGRKFVISLQITGRFLALLWIILIGFMTYNAPAELLWISSLFLFIGGGRKAEVSLVYTSFADVVPDGKRTRLLALVHAAEGLAGILSYPIGSLLMTQHLWMPFVLALVVFLVEYLVLWHTPETSPFLTRKGQAYSPRASARSSPEPFVKQWQVKLKDLLESADLLRIFQHRGLLIIFFSFFCKRIAFAGENVVPQYVSEALHRRISETYWFQACTSFGILLTLSILIPSITFRLVGSAKDLLVINGSLVNAIVGFLILWRGKSIYIIFLGLWICGLGEGLDVGLQSLGSHIVGTERYGTFFSSASMLGIAGELLGGPLMAAAYAVRDQNGAPLGYCFLLSAVLFTCLLICSRFITTKKLPRHDLAVETTRSL